MIGTTVVNLTLPIAPYGPIGSTFPWESPYWTEDIATVERNGAHLSYISMGSGTGTRLRGPSFARADAPSTAQCDLDVLVNRDAVVLRIPKRAGEAISPADVDAAIAASGDWRGSAVVIVTGWGDEERWRELGERYALESPHFTLEAAQQLRSVMRERTSDLLLTDCAHLDRIGAAHARAEWASAVPWQRPPWPSDQAKTYLRHYSPQNVQADWAASIALTRDAWAVVGLVNGGALRERRVRLTILPMFIQDVGEAPCTVVAELSGGEETAS